MKPSLPLLFLALSIAICGFALAQEAQKSKHIVAVLVQLRAEQNRINGLKTNHQYGLLDEVIKDREQVNKAEVNDFKDHFTYCPVYYFSDSNYDKVKDKQFDGVLFNADGTPVTTVPEGLKNGHFLVASYGQPIYQSRFDAEAGHSTDDAPSSDLPYDNALIISNEKMVQQGYFYRMGYGSRRLKDKNIYKYKSKHFNLEYYPAATLFNKSLEKDPVHIPIMRL